MLLLHSCSALNIIVDTMGSTMIPIYAFLLIGFISATPMSELRSELEFELTSTNLDDPAYRLLNYVQPTDYFVEFDVFLSERRFDGRVTITVDVQEEGLTQIVMHQDVVSILTVDLRNAAGEPVPLQFPDPFETDSQYEILKINLANPIATGRYTIEITFLGQINENQYDRGFYLGYYYLNNEIRYYATTQFQPYYARNAFPCFDEPQFKSRFVVAITRDSNLSPSYSNMAIAQTEEVSPGRIRETFLPTPIVSAYLLAFHVSDFVETTINGTAAKPFGIISRPGVTDQHEYASDIGLRITNELDSYLDFNYYDMGQGQPMKNDHIALPDFPSGAMENWGMVNYREAYLLYDPSNTNIVNKIFIATIMAHELAHKWFGNLVTCFWWSNLWLNESYASFFEYFAAHYADESLELDKQFVVDYVHSALTSDASAGATPMNWTDVVDNDSIWSHFSTTSYAKGASVLRMMEHFVGPTTFRNALRYYLRDNAYGLGTPSDMYAAFRTATAEDPTYTYSVDVGNVFDSWVQTRGAPVVNVNIGDGEITITQERFQLSGTPHTLNWHIPITWTHGGSPDFENTKPPFVLSTQTLTIPSPGDDWVIFNVQQSGLYRVNYDTQNWEKLSAQLHNNREAIHHLNRAQIVNDVLFFIRAGRIDTYLAFEILSFLKDETDYYVWAGALTQLDWIRRRLEHLPAAHAEFSEYMLELMDTVIEHLGYEEGENDSTSTILNRMQIMNYACNNLGHEGCVNFAVERWRQYRQNENVLVPVNLRRYVYCVGIREGDYTDYNFLLGKYDTSENAADMVVILRTLACTKDQTALRHYLEQSLYNDKIRFHDRTNAYNYALQGNKENLQGVLSFTYENFDAIRENYGGQDRLDVAISALATYLTDFQDITNFQTWLYTNQLQLPGTFDTGKAVINTGIANIQWGNSIATDLYRYLLQRNSATTVVTPFVLLIVTVAVNLLK